MSKVDDMLNKLFGDGIKDHYTLDDAKELITEDTTTYELLELKA